MFLGFSFLLFSYILRDKKIRKLIYLIWEGSNSSNCIRFASTYKTCCIPHLG